jgi:hypothetical protein
MNKEVKDIWTKELRSGQRNQGVLSLGYVEDGKDRFCCLGILCELAVKEGIIERIIDKDSYIYDGYVTALPEAVQKWAELGQFTRIKLKEGEVIKHVDITHINDVLEYSFEKIADLIEEQL